ncbi:MAG: NUDIX hydrolase [Acidiferrobacterales bacterium]
MVWKPHVTVAAIVEREGRFLMVEENTSDGIRVNQPAGHLENGESLVDAVVRETREETAWLFRPRGLLGVYRWPHPQKDITYIRFTFVGDVSHHDPLQALDSGILRASWMNYDDLIECRQEHRSSQVLACVNDYLKRNIVSLDFLNEPG